jgi:hypothetical protein
MLSLISGGEGVGLRGLGDQNFDFLQISNGHTIAADSFADNFLEAAFFKSASYILFMAIIQICSSDLWFFSLPFALMNPCSYRSDGTSTYNSFIKFAKVSKSSK